MNKYVFLGFKKSKTNNKKYDGLFRNRETGRIRKLPFGDSRYEHYKDTTGLGLFSSLNHMDMKRRRLYRQRHQKDIKKGYYSNGWLAMNYLW